MLETQKFLREHGLDALTELHKIKTVVHETLPLVLFKYDAIGVREANLDTHPITLECRSLVLEKDTWTFVSRSFYRFFNLEENKHPNFNFDHFWYQEKCDGSLISVFNYNGEWMIRTSGSFASGKVIAELDYTWATLFQKFLPLHGMILNLNPDYTYVFELMTPHNIVVKQHATSSITLLSAFHNPTMTECSFPYCDWIAEKLGVARPQFYNFLNVEEAVAWVNEQPYYFEGLVFIDKCYNRIKCKNINYKMVHRLKSNGNVFLARNLVPLILKFGEEREEKASSISGLREKWMEVEEEINRIFENCDAIHELLNGSGISQKEFAAMIKDEQDCVQSILFSCRQMNVVPSSVKINFEDLLIKYFETAKAVRKVV